MNRREFILGSTAAAAALVAIPAQLPAVVSEPAKAVQVARDGWWGYSTNGGEWWSGPFDSREEALAEAAIDVGPGVTVQTGWCVPREISIPDLREECTEWLACGGEEEESLSRRVVYAFEGCNEDNDWDGELSSAIHGADCRELVRLVRGSVCAALMRIDRADVAVIIATASEDAFHLSDDAYALLDCDAALERELDAAAEAWVRDQKLDQVYPRVLDLEREQEHVIPDRQTPTSGDRPDEKTGTALS